MNVYVYTIYSSGKLYNAYTSLTPSYFQEIIQVNTSILRQRSLRLGTYKKSREGILLKDKTPKQCTLKINAILLIQD